MFVVYVKESTRYANVGKERFATERAAKAAITRALKNGWIHDRNDVAIADAVDFAETIEKTKVVKNLMSGKPVTISVNTPRSCDPSSELYWSM